VSLIRLEESDKNDFLNSRSSY